MCGPNFYSATWLWRLISFTCYSIHNPHQSCWYLCHDTPTTLVEVIRTSLMSGTWLLKRVYIWLHDFTWPFATFNLHAWVAFILLTTLSSTSLPASSLWYTYLHTGHLLLGVPQPSPTQHIQNYTQNFPHPPSSSWIPYHGNWYQPIYAQLAKPEAAEPCNFLSNAFY